MRHLTIFALLFGAALCGVPEAAYTQEDRVSRYVEPRSAERRRVGENSYEFDVRERLMPGTALRLDSGDRPVTKVDVRLRREGGGPETYVKLGHRPEHAFEGGRRAQVDRNELHTLHWRVDSRDSGDALLLSAHNGDVYVDTITVHYSDERRAGRGGRDPYGDDYERGRMGGPAGDDGDSPDKEASRRCGRMDIAEPRFRLENRDQLSGIISGLLGGQGAAPPLQGELEGQCITEAGYYEQGRLMQRIDFPLDDRMDRRRFSVQINPAARGELRAYTVDGRREILPIEKALQSR